MEVHVTLGPRGEHAARIYRHVLDAILDGRLPAGARLPATRVLAEQLDVSRTTVALAYERLVAEGYLQGRVGAGTFVLATQTVAGDLDRPHATRTRRTVTRANPPTHDPTPRAVWRALPLSDTTVAPLARYPFTIGLPDIGLFGFETWRRFVGQQLRVSALGTGDYGEPEGLIALRAAIARHYGVSRGLRASADDVLVTRGAQQAIDLVTRVVVDPGSTVAVEDPGYPPARHVFTSMGARVVGVPVDEEGLVVDALPGSARLVYVTPSHQYPLGVAMSPARRTALLSWARSAGAVVVEDDYDSEFRYGQRPLQPLHSIDRSSHVVYIGTFSKTMFPALRLGFLIAPASLRCALRTAKQLSDWHTDTVSQAALAHFIDEGLLARHIRRASRHYAARRVAIRSWLGEMGNLLEALPSSAGLHLTALARPGVAIDDAVGRAKASGVVLRSVAPFHVDTPVRDGLMLGYGAIPVERIRDALRLLADALQAT
ncbi:MAG TPA: PLP-dependent aminotransferase family protein [Micromonosporaceae bacterium]|jgi:GntR family transcriptional regulator/MocR family aminotransferase